MTETETYKIRKLNGVHYSKEESMRAFFASIMIILIRKRGGLYNVQIFKEIFGSLTELERFVLQGQKLSICANYCGA